MLIIVVFNSSLLIFCIHVLNSMSEDQKKAASTGQDEMVVSQEQQAKVYVILVFVVCILTKLLLPLECENITTQCLE